MKSIRWFIGFLTLLLLITSCASDQHVASNALLQKRKYRRGFHLNLAQNKHTAPSSEVKLVAKSKDHRVAIHSEATEETTPIEVNKRENTQSLSAQNEHVHFANRTKSRTKRSVVFAEKYYQTKTARSSLQTDNQIKTIAALSFFSSILAWLALLASVVLLFLTFNILYVFIAIGVSVVFGLIGYYGGKATKDKVRAAEVGYSISLWYGFFWSIFFSTFLIFVLSFV